MFWNMFLKLTFRAESSQKQSNQSFLALQKFEIGKDRRYGVVENYIFIQLFISSLFDISFF